MCGIAGIFQLGRPVDQDELDLFTDSLAHRGPDGRGTFIDNMIGLGHRRLSILDLSEMGTNPMPYGGADGKRYWIVFNGEIYNFLELRKELEEKGHRFKSQTDTEVILAAYAEWGKSCLPRFNGMWAFAIWDTCEKTLFLSRDRFGIKPLYYYLYGDKLAFASEMKAFLALRQFHCQLHADTAAMALKNSYAYEGLTDQTLLQDVKKLQAGHLLTISNGKVNIEQWWNTADHIPSIPANYSDQVSQFREIFLDSVKIRMRSDVPIGTCLSGGVDSSAVASSMAWVYEHEKGTLERNAPDWQHAFIASFPGSKIDETPYANEVIKKINAKPHYSVFDQDQAINLIKDTVWSMEDVYGGLAVPVWNLYQSLRQNGIIVSLDGHGGDELLGGYQWYLDWAVSQANANLYSDFHKTLLPAILRNYDRCSMAHGIEVRMPIMDWRLVTFVFGLPPESKVGGGYTKRIFRDAMTGIMPESIRLRRAKIGFNSPMIEWFNGGMAPLIHKVVNHRLWIESPYWDGKQSREEILLKTKNKAWTYDDWGYSLLVWTLMNFVIWQTMFIEHESI
jgi:asparagine synthase (glutamine-hydrolysing)